MSDFGNKDSARPVRRRTGLDVISAVKMPEGLTAAVDAWAETQQLSPASPQITVASDAAKIEEIAVHEIEGLLDPALPADERERRIRRLTEGPPEFSHARIDLSKPPT